jgi:hypothetical protein
MTRSNHILPHMAEIATLLARYNVMENIYNEWPSLSVDPVLTESLIHMCARVLLYMSLLKNYRYSPVSSLEETDALRKLDKHIAEIQSADDACRAFTIKTFDEALIDTVELLDDESSDEEDPGALAPDASTKRARNHGENDYMEGSGWDGYGGMTGAEHGNAKAHRTATARERSRRRRGKWRRMDAPT